MGYCTRFELRWKPMTEHRQEPSCPHEKPEGARFCPICGVAVGWVKIDDKIMTFLDEHSDIYYGIEPDGSTTGESVKWYDYDKDMAKLSRLFPDYLFMLEGDGEESGDVWKAYFLNGKMQHVKAQLLFADFDPEKLEEVK